MKINDYTLNQVKKIVLNKHDSFWVDYYDKITELCEERSYKYIIELGTAGGISARMFLANVIKQRGHLICIDAPGKYSITFPTNYQHGESDYELFFGIEKDFTDMNISLDELFSYLTYYECSAEQVLNNDIKIKKIITPFLKNVRKKTHSNYPFLGLLFDSYDLLHIDTGPHTYEQTCMWLNSEYVDRVRKNGCILLHDIINPDTHEGVKKAINNFLKNNNSKYDYSELLLNSAGLGILIKKE